MAQQPEAWSQAASGGRIVVGARSAVLAPVARLRALVVLDAHADSYQEERVPTWEATVLGSERARREGVPCLLVSPCPTLELLVGRRLVTLSREGERSGWAPVELIDARDEDPRAGGYPSRLATLIRAAVGAEPGRPVLAVLNRKGRARLLACGRCQSLLRCASCGAALVQLERPAQGEPTVLHCPSCSSSGPAVCASCGPTRPRIVRPGVARVRDDLAGTHRPGRHRDRSSGRRARRRPGRTCRCRQGLEGVLHRAASASLVVFLDFDHELLAPRYRAGEQALALLALASRAVGGRRREGRGGRQDAAASSRGASRGPACGPGRLVAAEQPRRALLRLPPATVPALVSGDGAEQVAARPKSDPTVEVGGLAAGRFLIRAAGADALADALAAAGRPAQGARIEVGPHQV